LILAFLPVVGIPIIWIPVAVLQFVEGNVMGGIAIAIWGTFLSTIDNFLRPMIQRRVGSIHPFVSILGAVIGVSAFGLVGVVVGPLLLSYFILMVRMFNEEHVK
jgi:predicted PurR-regulated permease PerM